MDEEKFDLEQFPTSESAKRMLSYVTSGFYDNSYVGKWLYQVMGLEYDDAKKLAEELQYQMFPETATWGLMYHEIKWGLPVRTNLSYEERRQLIYQKRDYKAPMTPYRMEKYLKDATGFEVHIADVNDSGKYGYVATHPNVFKAYFLGEGTLDSKLVFGILNSLKQSHTTYVVNDRTEIEIDNSNLEQIVLRNIRFWFLVLYAKQYGVTAALALRLEIDMSMQETVENIAVVTKSKGCWFLNGAVLLDGSENLDSMCRKEIIE